MYFFLIYVIFKGMFIGVIGKVGSGKSSLLSAILGEMSKSQGHIQVTSSLCNNGFALAPQNPWIQHDTIMANIMFGQPFNLKKYEMVVLACALDVDFKVRQVYRFSSQQDFVYV